jgi:hypothetical protein
MRRFLAILVLLAVAAVGSGALRHVHELAHAEGHASHDESNCFVHAMLKMPMLGAGHVPALVFLGLFVAFLTSLPVQVLWSRPALLPDSRGPPGA